MADDTYTSNKRLNTGASEFNALSFIIENAIKGLVNTAIPVRVDACTVNSEVKEGGEGTTVLPAGYVSVTPLVQQRGADGKALAPVSIPKLPYFRYRAGKAAVVLDPQPGDIGFAVFAQQDISNLTQEGNKPVPAGSFRSYDMSDGFYMGGLLSAAPTTWVVLDPNNERIEINAPTEIVLKSDKITMKAKTSVSTSAGTSVSTDAGKTVSTNAGTSVATSAGTAVTTNANSVSTTAGSTVTTTAPAIGMNGPFTAGAYGSGSAAIPGAMTLTGDITLKGNMNVLGSGATVTAPEFVGHLTGNVNGLCSGAH